MDGQKKLFIISGSVLAFLLMLKLVENLPSMFSTFQQNILLGTGVTIILVIAVKVLFY